MLPVDNRILYFNRDRSRFGFLSHFYPAPFTLDGEIWPTVEHYYQAQRSEDPRYRQAIRAALTPGHAKRLAASPDDSRKQAKRSWFRRHGASPRSDWKEVKLQIMRTADRAKFTQNPDLAAKLLSTGTAELVEDSPWEPFWGIGKDGRGANWAGRILMEIRQELHQKVMTSRLKRQALVDIPSRGFDRHGEIEVLAFLIWEKSGGVEGRTLEHWLEAEDLVRISSFVIDGNRLDEEA